MGMKRKIRMKFSTKENIEGCFSDEELDQEDVNDLENDEFKKPTLDNVNRVKELKKYQDALLYRTRIMGGMSLSAASPRALDPSSFYKEQSIFKISRDLVEILKTKVNIYTSEDFKDIISKFPSFPQNINVKGRCKLSDIKAYLKSVLIDHKNYN